MIALFYIPLVLPGQNIHNLHLYRMVLTCNETNIPDRGHSSPETTNAFSRFRGYTYIRMDPDVYIPMTSMTCISFITHILNIEVWLGVHVREDSRMRT